MPIKDLEKRKQYNKEYNKEYRQKNKEKILEQKKEYYEQNKEEIAKREKEYYEQNKEQLAEKRKEYRQKNKEKIKEYKQKNKEQLAEKRKEYNKTPNAKKINKIREWKYKGLIHDDYFKLYDDYLESTECQECGVTYGVRGDGTGTFKCMDHDHETGLFRNFLCTGCNIRRR